MTIKGISPEFRKLDEHREHFTPAGINGLLDHWELTNPLGQRLAQGDAQFKSRLRALVTNGPETPQPRIALRLWHWDIVPQDFFQAMWDALLGSDAVSVPVLPQLGEEAQLALQLLGLRPFYFPDGIRLDDQTVPFSEYRKPKHWADLSWRHYLHDHEIVPLPFTGRWLFAETCARSDWQDPHGFGRVVVDRLKLETPEPKYAKSARFGHSWDDLHADDGVLHRLSGMLGVAREQVRLPSVREANGIGNFLSDCNRMLEHRASETAGSKFADLGAADSWEWTEDRYGPAKRIGFGGVREKHNGLSRVLGHDPGERSGTGTFRIVVSF